MKRSLAIVAFFWLLAGAHAQPVIRKFDASPRSATAGAPVTLSWEVDKASRIRIDPDVGVVSSKGTRAVTPGGDVTYTITAVDAAGVERRMTVNVAVAPAPTASAAAPPPPRAMGLGRVTGRHLLPTGVPEDPGFGLYSYLLFGEKENTRNHDRYLAVLRQVLTEVASLAEILANQPDLRRVNVLYIPVLSTLKSAEDSPGIAPETILKNYDFGRAEILLSSIGDRFQNGPYFVSVLKPISKEDQVGRPYLFQDLSRADASLASDWVKQFLSQAAREDPWDESKVQLFALNLRNQIQRLSSFAPAVSWNQSR